MYEQETCAAQWQHIFSFPFSSSFSFFFFLFLFSYHGLGHGGNDLAGLDEDAGLGARLERLLGGPLGADGDAQRALVLLPRLEGVGELGGEVAVVLSKGQSSVCLHYTAKQGIAWHGMLFSVDCLCLVEKKGGRIFEYAPS